MLENSKENPSSVGVMVANALDRIPNFSDELQTNNVLTRRILELKVQKGFAINKEEAEIKMQKILNIDIRDKNDSIYLLSIKDPSSSVVLYILIIRIE